MVRGCANPHLVYHRADAALVQVDADVGFQNGLKKGVGEPLACGAVGTPWKAAVQFPSVDRVVGGSRAKRLYIGDRNDDESAAKLFRICTPQKPMSDRRAVQFVPVADRLYIGDLAGVASAYENERDARRRSVVRFADRQIALNALSRQGGGAFQLKRLVSSMQHRAIRVRRRGCRHGCRSRLGRVSAPPYRRGYRRRGRKRPAFLDHGSH